MRVEFLLEEQSAEAALKQLVPKLLPAEVDCEYHSFQGKPDLLTKLPERLRGYSKRSIPDLRIVVLIDRDNDNCRALKRKVEGIIHNSHIVPVHSQSNAGSMKILTRIAIEEIEAWFLGDMMAIRKAYPRVPDHLEKRKGLRSPDEIKGGTWEYLERILQKHGYYRGGLEKIRAASEIAIYMEPSRNRSRSFQAFCQGLNKLIAS